MSQDLVADLEQRGLLYQKTAADLGAQLAKGPVTGYAGFDPSSDSLHVGNLVPLMLLVRLQQAGHRPIALVGGGTGMIGDPSGKQSERSMLTPDSIAANVAGVRRQLESVLDFDGPRGALLVDNADWLDSLGLIEFLRDTGKHFTVNQMVARDSVRPRLEDPERWISYTEFSYMLLQAYDYLALHDRHECTLQVGGSDQWGNIVSGCDLIRRRRSATAHGLTVPLLLKADGSKFGKTESGTVWLDPNKTSVYEFYQFWRNTADADVMRMLRVFTTKSMAELDELAQEVERAPQERAAQRLLAEDVTDRIHGRDARVRAEETAAALFGGSWADLEPDQLRDAFAGFPRTELAAGDLTGPDGTLVAVLATVGLSPSRGQARQAIKSGAVHLNNSKVTDIEYRLGDQDRLAGGYIVLRRGKKAYHVIQVV